MTVGTEILCGQKGGFNTFRDRKIMTEVTLSLLKRFWAKLSEWYLSAANYTNEELWK